MAEITNEKEKGKIFFFDKNATADSIPDVIFQLFCSDDVLQKMSQIDQKVSELPFSSSSFLYHLHHDYQV